MPDILPLCLISLLATALITAACYVFLRAVVRTIADLTNRANAAQDAPPPDDTPPQP